MMAGAGRRMKSDFAVAIDEAVRIAMPERGIVGDFVIIAECYFDDGEATLFTGRNPDIAVWKELGMLHYRATKISNGGFDYGDEGDDA